MQQKIVKIFIADDEVDILDILKLMLKTHGYQVITSTDPNTIFEFKAAELPDIILLDIWMSGLDGRDICKQLKQTALTKDIPVIFVSANSNIMEIAKECHANGYIAKPFEMSHLLKTINANLPAA
ncbi:MAG: response regulator [Rhizobacter sp.]|nr:response regulator [Ferruginibacter sp.]